MATIFNQHLPSLNDLVKAGDYYPEDMKMFLGEMAKEDALMQAIPWLPTTHGMTHKNIRASKLGHGEFVQANEGRGQTSSDFKLEESSICYFSILSKVDDTVLSSGTSEQANRLRLSQDQLNLEGFTQNFTEKMFYGSVAENSKGFNGFKARRNKKSGEYFFDAGKTTGDTTSVYVMQFGKDGVHLRYNPANPQGIYMKDRGMHSYERTIDGEIRTVDLWETEYNIWSLLNIFDERTLIRYGNLNPDVSATSNQFQPKDMIKIKNKLPKLGRNAAAFCTREIITQAELELFDKSNVYYTRGEIESYGEVIKVVSMPLLLQDCISLKETVVS